MDIIVDAALVIAAVAVIVHDSYMKRHAPIRIENWAQRRAEK